MKIEDIKNSCCVLLLLAFIIIAFIVSCSYNNNVNKIKKDNRQLKKELSHKEERLRDLEKLNKSYEWELDQVSQILENKCKGE